MYVILNESYALRSFWKIKYAYYQKGHNIARGLTKEQFDLLLKCDGLTDIEDTETLQDLIRRGMVNVINKGEKSLTSWQKYRHHDNTYMPQLDIQITGKCNYNCKHCFNCKDNLPLQSELSLEYMIKFLDECVDCGINAITITGGEPLLHPHFKEIIEEIYKRNMIVFAINTNGFYINQEILDFLKSLGCHANIKISFDGLGYHNWMRGYSKAEEVAINAIKLCIKNGFTVSAQMNVNKVNKDSILPSLEYLDSLGVYETRLLKTTEAPRWKEQGMDQTFSFLEYYDFMLDLLKDYINKDHNMSLSIWALLTFNPRMKYFILVPAQITKEEYRETLPICKGARGMMCIGSDGECFPCMQMQGYFTLNHISYANVIKMGLKKVLQDSTLLCTICKTLKDKKESSEKCRNCKYFTYCGGGCPALAVLSHNGDYSYFYKEDLTKCSFFENGYYQKYCDLFKGYKNGSPIEEDVFKGGNKICQE